MPTFKQVDFVLLPKIWRHDALPGFNHDILHKYYMRYTYTIGSSALPDIYARPRATALGRAYISGKALEPAV